MAEERLIDDDKDKKYRFIINADGEEELVVKDDDEAEAEQPEKEVYFDVPEVTEDNEEEVVMTPEQLAAKRAKLEKEQKEIMDKAQELIKKAEKDLKLNRFATALEYLEQSEELYPENGDLYALRLAAYTRNYTDFTQIVQASESADGITKYTSEEAKAEIFSKTSAALENNIAELRSEVSELNEENEEKKKIRAEKFKKDRNITLIVFCVAAAVLAGLGVCTGVFASLILSVPNNTYLILTCVFGGLTFIALIGAAFAARWLNITCRRLRLNKRNTSTKLGRELLGKQEKLKAFLAVYAAVKGEK